jgi:hypothetical protein
VCDPKTKGLKTPFKSAQPLAKITPNQHRNNGAQSVNGLGPKIANKLQEKWGWGGLDFVEKNWGKRENGSRR